MRNLILAALVCFGFSSARAWDPNKPFIYEMKIAYETDNWINMYSTATVLSKSDNAVAFRVVANSTTAPTYQLVVTTQGNVGIGMASPTAALDVNGNANFSGYQGFGSKLAFKMGGWGYSGSSASRSIDVLSVPNITYGDQDGYWFWGQIIQNRAQGVIQQRLVTTFSAGVDRYGYGAAIEGTVLGTGTAPSISWSNSKLTITVNVDYSNSYVIVYAQGGTSHDVKALVWHI